MGSLFRSIVSEIVNRFDDAFRIGFEDSGSNMEIREGLTEFFGVRLGGAQNFDRRDRAFQLGQVFSDMAIEAGERFFKNRCCHYRFFRGVLQGHDIGLRVVCDTLYFWSLVLANLF
jgi:hypothetical protein